MKSKKDLRHNHNSTRSPRAPGISEISSSQISSISGIKLLRVTDHSPRQFGQYLQEKTNMRVLGGPNNRLYTYRPLSKTVGKPPADGLVWAAVARVIRASTADLRTWTHINIATPDDPLYGYGCGFCSTAVLDSRRPRSI
ncbi:hypothetical protein J6590_038037 [Homalodisca vitripennis]|nr:hypothetical protein J6590_038037 [Homalodisca vitripennis]